MRAPRKAVILAAGLGNRMRPLTLDVPKPLLPLWGVPAIDRNLAMLAAWGVRDVLVNLHHGADALLNHLRAAQPHHGLRTCLSFEPDIQGTGGALWVARWFLDDDPFWLINADIAVDVRPEPFLRTYARHRPLAAVWLVDDQGPRTVRMTDECVANFSDPHAGDPGTYTLAGLHLVSPALRTWLRPGPGSIVETYRRAMTRGAAVRGVVEPGAFWADLGTPESYLDAHGRLRRGRVRAGHAPAAVLSTAALQARGADVRGFAAVAADAHIGRGARLCDSVVLPYAAVAAGARIEAAIVGPGACIAGRVSGLAVAVPRAGVPALTAACRGMGWNPARSFVVPMEARGSARVFYRTGCGTQRAIVIRYSLERQENGLYAGHARFLRRARIPAPAVLWDDPKQCTTAVEDLGDLALTEAVRGCPSAEVEALYAKVLAVAVRFHASGRRLSAAQRASLCEPFGPRLYRWEHELFARHCLRATLGCRASTVTRILDELRRVGEVLSGEPPVLVHRDFQSSNLLLVRDEPYVIDFQGMRFGPALYDIASLLCDPYVELDAPMQRRLLERYADLANDRRADLATRFWFAAVQRLVQALGAFGRLGGMPGTRRFLRHVPPAMRMLDRALRHVPGLTCLRRCVAQYVQRADSGKEFAP